MNETHRAPTGGLTMIDGVEYYRIDGVEEMDPFLMTVVSDSDLWMFVSSTGALTAGRVDADHSLFPYETDDRLHRAAGITGPVTVIAKMLDGRRELWRPFGAERNPSCSRSIAKGVLGDRLVFEERHHEWRLEFRATWAPSKVHGRAHPMMSSVDWPIGTAEFGLVSVSARNRRSTARFRPTAIRTRLPMPAPNSQV